jgi:hypothetical protein
MYARFLDAFSSQIGTVAPESPLVALENVLADQTRVLGADYPDTLSTRCNIAFWLAQEGQVEQSIAYSQTLLTDQVRILGADHPDSFATRYWIACCQIERGSLQVALATLDHLIRNTTEAVGSEDGLTLRARSGRAYVLAELGRTSEAAIAGEAVLADQIRVLGPNHDDTCTTRERLAQWRGQRG